MKEFKFKEITKILLDIAVDFGKKGKGSFFVITNSDISKHYCNLYPDLFGDKDISIRDKETLPLIKKLAELDGAIIVNKDGKIITYGAEILVAVLLKGHGTRHNAAFGISKFPDTTVITSSEEDGCVRIFKEGIPLVEINPHTKVSPKLSEKIASFLSSESIPLLSSGGIASIALGINPLMAVIVFAGSYVITKKGIVSINRFLRSGKFLKDEAK